MEEGSGALFFIISIALGIWLWHDSKIIDDYRSALSSANAQIVEANGQIEDANSEIEDENSSIDDAKAQAWSDYDTMGQTLDELSPIEHTVDTVETVPDPHPKQN